MDGCNVGVGNHSSFLPLESPHAILGFPMGRLGRQVPVPKVPMPSWQQHHDTIGSTYRLIKRNHQDSTEAR